tara:strand:+ start:456 stop:773 length:318 start_codon:yes stop_codon:yes gene_type:complete
MAESIDQKKRNMTAEIDNRLNGLTIPNREKEAVDDYLRDSLNTLDDFAEIQSAYPVFFCGISGVNPMPMRQQQRYASQRIMQASLSTLIPRPPRTQPPHNIGHHQ